MMECGHRLLPSFIDEIASNDSNRVFVQTPKTIHVQDGLCTITFGDLAKAIDNCAWWIKRELGSGHEHPTVAYIGPHDLRYLILAVGACKAEFKMFFVSPRNSSTALSGLLQELSCNIFLIPKEYKISKNLQEVLAGRPMDLFDFPDLSYFIENSKSACTFVWRRTFEETKNEALAIFHTSGSTGMPKPVVITHGAIAALDAFGKLPSLSGKMVQTSYHIGRTTLLLFPMFHTSALATLFLSIWNQIPTILPPPVPLTADLANELLMYCHPEVSIMPPSILVDIAANPHYLSNLHKCHHVQYGGGPVPTKPGNLIAAGTRLITVFGSSETGFFPVEINEQNEWAYVKLSPYAGGEFRQYTKDLYELVIVRDGKLVDFQPVFWTYPKLHEYYTKDLFSKHPSKPDLWLWQGRIDDIIVLGNGEKFNPTSMENTINGHPFVDSALICGQGRVQCALLVELSSSRPDSVRSSNRMLDDLWPVIQKAHMDCPEYALLTKETILFTGPEKKMIRADKGTVRRKITIEHFAPELDALYRNSEEQAMATECITDLFDIEVVENALLNIVRETPKFADIGVDEDFFARGLDSLHAMTISRRIRATFPNASIKITNKAIYDFPSACRLARYISGLADEIRDPIGEMQRIYDRYSTMLPTVTTGLETSTDSKVVLLTGSTGNLGSYLLNQLLSDNRVNSIYCLNRSADAEQRQKQTRSSHGFPSEYPKKVTFIQTDHSLPQLGIPSPTYSTLQANITHIIHNAWPVDFLLPLSSFETSIKSIIDLIELSAGAVNSPPITFVSSVGAVLNQPDISSAIPETPFSDWHVAAQTGYTRSKLIAERLLTTASSTLGLQTTICRVCQLAGSSEKPSTWPEKEWVPAMMKTSRTLGSIPEDLGTLDTVNWLPVDVAAAVLCELVFSDDTDAVSRVFHVANTKVVCWKDILPSNLLYGKLKRVSLAEWIEELKGRGADDIEDLPAAKFVGFFEGISVGDRAPDLDASEAVKVSALLADASPITRSMMEKWF